MKRKTGKNLNFIYLYETLANTSQTSVWALCSIFSTTRAQCKDYFTAISDIFPFSKCLVEAILHGLFRMGLNNLEYFGIDNQEIVLDIPDFF